MKLANFYRHRGFTALTLVIILGIMTSMLIMVAKSASFYKKIAQEEQVIENLSLIYPAFYSYFYTECSLSALHTVDDPTLSKLESMGYLTFPATKVNNPIGTDFKLSIERSPVAPTKLLLTTTFHSTKRAKRVAKRKSIAGVKFIAPATVTWELSTTKFRKDLDANSASYLDDKCR